MLSLRNFTGATALSSSSHSAAAGSLFSYRLVLRTDSSSRIPRCSFRVQELSREEPLESQLDMSRVFTLTQSDKNDRVLGEGLEEEEEQEEEDEKGISKIRVARQKYIPVSKAEILNAIALKLFESQDDADEFRLLSS